MILLLALKAGESWALNAIQFLASCFENREDVSTVWSTTKQQIGISCHLSIGLELFELDVALSANDVVNFLFGRNAIATKLWAPQLVILILLQNQAGVILVEAVAAEGMTAASEGQELQGIGLVFFEANAACDYW